jgi:hypothetical protein
MSKIMSDEPLGPNPGSDSLAQPASSNKPRAPWFQESGQMHEVPVTEGEGRDARTVGEKYVRQDVPELTLEELALHEDAGIIPVVPGFFEGGMRAFVDLQRARADAIWKVRLAKKKQGGYLWRAAVGDEWQTAPPQTSGMTTTESVKRGRTVRCCKCGGGRGFYEVQQDGRIVCVAGCAP